MIFRVSKDKSNPYVMINKSFVNDSSISWKAKGILLYLLSKPDDWKVREGDIVNHAKDGRDSVRAAIRELIKAGYIVRTRCRDDMGRLAPSEYVVYEVPPSDWKPGAGETVAGKSNTTNNESTNNDHTNNESYIIKNDDHLHPLKKDDCLHPSPKDAHIFFNLYESDDPFVQAYLKVMTGCGLKHKRMSKDNYYKALSWVHMLQENHTVDDFSEAAQEHFDNLPKSNDGDILPFLKASQRYFNEQLEDLS